MLEQLEQLRAEGLIRFVGFSSEDNNAAVYDFIHCGRFDVMQIAYNLLFQHPYDFSRPCGSMMEAQAAGLGIVTMRTLTSGLLQKWVQAVNPANTFDYTPALIQFVLSNPAVDVALVGMRTPAEVTRNVQSLADLSARLDLTQLHAKFL
jgi:predicted aldo/keto reductase-like oxidoreductase